MKNIFVLLLLSSLTFLHAQNASEPVNGGVARTAALGGGPNNPYIPDYTDVFTNPAYALKYKHLLFGDIGYSIAAYSAAGQYVGVTLGFDTISVGIAIGRREGAMFGENATSPGNAIFKFADDMTMNANAYGTILGQTVIGRPIVIGEPNTPVQIFGAYRLKNVVIGVAFYRSGWSQMDEGTGNVGIGQKLESSQGQTGVKVGMLMELNQSVTVDAAILFRNNSSTIEFSDTAAAAAIPAMKYDANGNEISINARAFVKLSEKMDIVPLGRFGYFSYEPLITRTPAPPFPALDRPNSYSKTEYEIGAAINSKFSGGWATVGLSLQSIKLTNDVTTQAAPAAPLQTTKNSVTWLDLPKINVGTEFELLSWLTGRLGYFKRLSTQKTVSEPFASKPQTIISGTQSGYVPNLGLTTLDQQLSLGLGLKLSRLAIDGYIGERFLSSGSYLLSGNVQDLFCILSASVKL